MTRSNPLFTALLFIPMLLPVVSACSLGHSKAAPAALTAAAFEAVKPVAEVNGTRISRAELDRAKKVVLANKPGLKVPPLLQKEFELQTLNQLISSELLFQAGRKLEAKDLDRQASHWIYSTSGVRSEERVDEQGLLESTRRDLTIAYLVNTQIAAEVEVSEAEIDTFYQQNPDKFGPQELVRARHILIGVDGKAGAEERKSARVKAETLRDELAKGADFAELARANSTCPSSKQGGDLGFFGRGKMVPHFEMAAFALQPGGLSSVVETQYGYHLINVTERNRTEQIPLAAAQEKIRFYLKTQKINAAIEIFVAAARKSAKIELYL